MGSRNGPYEADFPVGTTVQVVDLDALERFRESWRLHHPLEERQLAFAGTRATVREVGYYHGGDELYQLHGVPGTWHERCLVPVD